MTKGAPVKSTTFHPVGRAAAAFLLASTCLATSSIALAQAAPEEAEIGRAHV